MPTYRYRCGTCGAELEVWQSIKDDPLREHEGCGGELRRVLTPAGIVLKGSGFYKTDSRSGNGKSSGAPKPERGGSTEPASTSSGSGDSTSSSSSPSSAPAPTSTPTPPTPPSSSSSSST